MHQWVGKGKCRFQSFFFHSEWPFFQSMGDAEISLPIRFSFALSVLLSSPVHAIQQAMYWSMEVSLLISLFLSKLSTEQSPGLRVKASSLGRKKIEGFDFEEVRY